MVDVALEEDSLRMEMTLELRPKPTLDQHGEEVPGKGNSKQIGLELKAITLFQDLEEHKDGIVVKFEELRLADQTVKAFAKTRQSVIPDAYMTRELILCARIGD